MPVSPVVSSKRKGTRNEHRSMRLFEGDFPLSLSVSLGLVIEFSSLSLTGIGQQCSPSSPGRRGARPASRHEPNLTNSTRQV
jgi:hypothetical protein